MMLGMCADHGQGGPVDHVEANRLYKLACEGGEIGACGMYGYNLFFGRGIEQDRDQGKKLLQIGCQEGDSWSCKKLRKVRFQ